MERRYKPGEFAKKINRSIGTLRLWDKKGNLPAKRLPSGHRYYTVDSRRHNSQCVTRSSSFKIWSLKFRVSIVVIRTLLKKAN